MKKKCQNLSYIAAISVIINSGISFAYAQNNTEQSINETQPQDNKPIIVTGQSLNDSLKNLEACLARACPPNEDIDASLAHAENLFIEGEYQDARKIIDDSLKRNKKHAADYPIPVSDLYRSNSRVLEHLGLIDKSNFAVLKMRDTLKKHLNDDKRRILGAELEIAHAHLKDGLFKKAVSKYKNIRKQALEENFENLAGVAKIRELNIHLTRAIAGNNNRLKKKARDDIVNYIAAINDPENRFSSSAKILLARYDREFGNIDTTDEIIKFYTKINSGKKPILISSDPIELEPILAPLNQNTATQGTPVSQNSDSLVTEDFDDRWADFGFFINDSGRVEEIEVLRISGADNWIPAVAKSIQSRIYSPRRDPNSNVSLGQYIVERYSYTSEFTSTSSSRIKVRSGNPIVRRLDLTVYE